MRKVAPVCPHLRGRLELVVPHERNRAVQRAVRIVEVQVLLLLFG